jgi:hypothetical protein
MERWWPPFIGAERRAVRGRQPVVTVHLQVFSYKSRGVTLGRGGDGPASDSGIEGEVALEHGKQQLKAAAWLWRSKRRQR